MGQATDTEIAREILKVARALNNGASYVMQLLEQIERDTERDRFLRA